MKLAQDYVGRGAICGSQVGIKLQELGPRMMLELVKVQEGLCDGAVLYHSLVHKEAGEAEASEQRREEKVPPPPPPPPPTPPPYLSSLHPNPYPHP